MISPSKPAQRKRFVIDAMPTKALFIDMLTRDIGLIPAVVDLVDNCTDGAQRIRGEKNFAKLWVRLEFNGDEFRISDNCGGMTPDVAQHYAFRFGRPESAPTVKHSVGQFGVGMKRAMFKIGREISVESTTDNSHFELLIDVDKWASDEKWEFQFSKLKSNLRNVDADRQGTTICIRKLREAVAREFQLPSFLSALKSELEVRIRHPLSRRLAITVNGVPLGCEPLQLLSDPSLAPAYWEKTFQLKNAKPVRVKLYCGLGESKQRSMAGWHVFCNGRLILEGDKTEATGWGEKAGEIEIPSFHGQYNAFRGYAFFDSDDASRLPWNTTKTGVNYDSEIWQAVRLQMISLMHPVKAFLDSLKKEKEDRDNAGDDGPGPLEKIVNSSDLGEIHNVTKRERFVAPVAKTKPKPVGPKMGNILYSKPVDEIRRVMKEIGANSYKEVGEMTFDYYMESELD